MADFASESGHWYDAKTGEPRYRIVGANGVERDTTLRDAKKSAAAGEPWYIGATTVIAQRYRYQLEDWKLTQGIMAALTTQRLDGETDEAFVERIKADSKEQARKAAERGTEIHAAVEAYYAGRLEDPEIEPLWRWVVSIRNLITQTFGQQSWRPEKSFAHPLGYGGKVDLHSDSVLIDFKGKEKPYAKWATYDDHAMQLAAYAHGLSARGPDRWVSPTEFNWPRAGIIFFDRAEPYAEWHEVKADKLERGWRMFEPLLAYWKAANL